MSAPPTVPASFWEHEPLRQALVDRHLGRVIRAYRCHPYHGRVALPQTVVAGWLGITQAQLSRVENGPALVHLDRLAHWAQLIGIPASCLWFSLPGQTRQSVEKVETTHDSTDLKDAGPDEGRRALLAGIAAVAAGAGLLGGSELVQPRRIGTADIARLNAVLELYRSVDRESGGGLLYREVARFAESVYRMLDWSHPAGLTSPLIAAVATARQLAGWTALDAGRHADAQRHFVAGERAALAAQDVPLVAMIRYAQAKQLQHLRHNRDALATLQLTHAQLGSHATPAAKALLWGAEAASIAALGDHQTAVRTLGKASDQFERINKEHEPGRMGFYDRGELLAQHGRVYRDMARRDARHAAKAVHWGRDSIAAFGAGNVRSTVLNEVGMCSALFLADEPEQAIEIGNRLLEKSQVMSSKRVIDRVINLRRDLARHRELPEVAAFDRVLTARAAAA
ncbi:XRE family transcriptional regulator [Micromonospora ureilytica]|uniref:helix-turn-helix domain-containing protein n=1 Tax=Micromonospora ureilytica TaxID=709868 RepID=UPI002E0D9C13|nr:XRE family transcriptional regulator [Micromonospora ureilytica]